MVTGRDAPPDYVVIPDDLFRRARAVDYRDGGPATEPLLWVADAVCGAVEEYVLGEDTTPVERLLAANVVDEQRFHRLP